MFNAIAATETVLCRHDGLELVGQVIAPEGSGPYPGVLVVHSAFGLGGHIPAVAARFAAAGYVALAVDMYGAGAYSEDPDVIAGLVRPLWGNAERLRARMSAWLSVLRSRPDVLSGQVAAIGYCFGGQCVLELARGGGDVRAVVSFHGILTTDTPAERGAVRAKVAVHTGGLDPHAPRAHVDALREELTSAGADWQVSEYANCYHAFTDPSASTPQTGRAYDAIADQVSWASTLGLLSAVLKS